MREKPITDQRAQEFMAAMKGVRTHRVCRAMTRACISAVNFYGCSMSHCANAWAASCAGSRAYRFAPGTTIDTLRADALNP